MTDNEFLDVLGILWQHGDQIMTKYSQAIRSEDKCVWYDCLYGNSFLTKLFGKTTAKRTINFMNKRRPQGAQEYTSITDIGAGIYHFRLETELLSETTDINSDQVHYFTIINDSKPLLLQTLGGVKGILIKRIYGDINMILTQLISANSDTFTKLFEVPPYLNELANYQFTSFSYYRQPLHYPTLTDLNRILEPLHLDYAIEKLSYKI
jgi:hypothetical protein